MASPVQFAVDDSSPVLAYAPFADTFGQPDLAAGWNPYFVGTGFVAAPGQAGIGESQHITSRNGSSISLRWHGTSLQLFGNTTADASLSLVLDGVSVSRNISNNTPNLLAFLDGLEHSDHNLTLTALTPSPPGRSLVVFDKAVITDPPPQNSSNLIFSDHTLDDNDISFTGPWSQLTFPSARESTSQGDTAQVTFSGIAIRVFGTTSPSSGNYSITLDGLSSPIFSARSSFVQSDSLLFFASGLDPDVSHHIIIRNEGGSLQLKSGGSGFDIFSSGEPTALPSSPSPPSSSPPANTPTPSSGIGKFAKGTIAALVLAGFLAALLLTAVLFYFCIWRPRRRKRTRQQQLDAVQEATSQLRRNPKEVQNNPVGVVLDIAQQRHPDDILANNPVDVLTPLSPSPINPNAERPRDSKQSAGFARWKRDIQTLSGLTNLGLKFRHDDSDEKSPLSDNGRRYTSEIDSISPISPSVGRMMSLTTQSSHRSLGRLGKKRSAGNNGGRSGGFPFRFNSGRSSSNNGGRDGGGPTPLSPTRDEDSLSGLTSLSYASNPNLEGSVDIPAATATTPFLDVQPPSYAASVSQHTASGSSSGNLSPRAGSELPLPSQLGRDAQLSVQTSFERQQQRQSSSSSSTGNQQQRNLQRSDTRMRGMRMLGLGGGGSASTGGVGGPISMRAAIRGLSPRISRNRNGGGGGGKEREVIGEEEGGQAAAGSSQHSIALASVGHDQYAQERQGEDVEMPPVPDLPAVRRKPVPAIRALPPIPIPPPAAATIAPVSEDSSRLSEQRQQRRRRDVNISTNTVPSLSSAPSPSSPPPSSSQSHSPTNPPPPIVVTTSTTAEKKPFVSTKVARSSPGDAVGLPPLGTIQSFAEAAAIAITNTSGFRLSEGSDSPTAGGGDGQRDTKRSSTASRVRFEEPSTTTVSGDDDGTAVQMEGDKRRKEEKTGFRLTPPTPITGPPGSSSSSEYPSLAPAVPGATSVAQYGRSSFLDLSSQPPSIRSNPSVRRNDNHDNIDDNNNDNDDNDNDNHDRIWSMQLPGRRGLYPAPLPPPTSSSSSSGPPSDEDPALKSKWSNTTMQTVTRTLGGGGSSFSASASSSSDNNHSNGYRVRPPSIIETEGDVLSPTTRQNLFPFPLAIPPSPNMPEGFTGVEPSPSLMSPAVGLPVSFSSARRRNKEEKRGSGRGKRGKRRFFGVGGFGEGDEVEEGDGNEDEVDEHPENSLHIPSSARRTGNASGSTDATNSPTDSFPYSISDVHFRNSGVSVPLDEGDGGQLGDATSGRTRHHHHRQHHHQTLPHPPLPSLTPQRFSPSLSQQSQSQSQSSAQPPLPSLRSLTPQQFDPYLPQSYSPQPTPALQQQQQQRLQEHERTQSFTSSIIHRVFGTR